MERETRILLIEDNPGDVRLIETYLAEGGFRRAVAAAGRLEEGLARMAADSFDVVLLDLSLPDSTGFETFGALREADPHIPVIVLTGLDDEDLAVQMLQRGAQDYLIKGDIDAGLLRRSIRYAIERASADAALRQSEEKYRTLVENLSDILYVTDVHGAITFLNDAGRQALQAAGGGAEGRPLLDFVHPDDRADAAGAFRAVLAAGRPLINYECRMAALDGKAFPVIMNVAPLTDRAGAVTGTEGTARDITPLKDAEEEISVKNKQLSLTNAILSISTAGTRVDTLSAQFLDLLFDEFALDAGQVYVVEPDGRHARLRYARGMPEGPSPEETVDIGAPAYAPVFGEGRPRYEEVARDGAVVAAAIPFTVNSDVYGAVLLYRQDGGAFGEEERRILEAAGREMGIAVSKVRLQSRLEEAIEEANLYLDIMAHDINNANTASIGYAELLISMLEGGERDIARKLLTSVQKSVEIIGNVNTIRRLRERSPELRRMALDPLVREEMRRYSDVHIAYGGTDVEVIADDLLSEVFTNLIGNSIKFGGPDVAIAIEVAERDGEVVVSVTDNGPGIPAEDKPHIFSRFRRGTTTKSGKGLGLYISRMLIERYGGEIWAEDRVAGRPEEGAVMRFTLKTAVSPQ
ncbi:MAG: ATP-binding protein [Methanomicrobiaceae archaeon]|nr:ATP-binding protein [Methanomicrobiaceae archaeon]